MRRERSHHTPSPVRHRSCPSRPDELEEFRQYDELERNEETEDQIVQVAFQAEVLGRDGMEDGWTEYRQAHHTRPGRCDESASHVKVYRGSPRQCKDSRFQHRWQPAKDVTRTRYGGMGDGPLGRYISQWRMRSRCPSVGYVYWVRIFGRLQLLSTDLWFSESLHTLRGHTSTVRCLKMPDANTAISGSRDTTLRVWDIKSGLCKNVLVGHQASVRCLEIKGDIVVSGSYDTTARVWSISEGRCLRTLSGHFSQIYAIAFDGTRIATGSLDTSVRIWDPNTG